MSYQNGDENMEAAATPLLSSIPQTVETPKSKILLLAAAATACVLVVAAITRSPVTSGISGPTDFAQVLLANDLRNTGDNADGPLKFLDRHSVDCGNQAINYFHWNAGSRHFDINCAGGNGVPVSEPYTRYTDWNGGGNSGINFLDRHRLACDGKALLSAFQVETRGTDDLRFRYQCREWSPVDSFQCTEMKTTRWNEIGPSNSLAYLDRHGVQCDKNGALQTLKAVANGGNFQYAFTCCSMTSDKVYPSQSDQYWDKSQIDFTVFGVRWPITKGTQSLLDKVIWDYTNPSCGVENNCIQEFFPEANGVGDWQYHKNDWLLQYSRLMLGFVVAGYYFEDGLDKGKLMAITPMSGLKEEPQNFCSAKDSDRPINYAEITIARGTSDSWDGPGTAASLYEYETADEYLVVWQFRGSQIGYDPAKMGDFVKDWLGSDLDMNPIPDQICFNPQVELHQGFTEAFLVVKDQMVAAVTKSYDNFLQRGDKPVKIFITGHSLGAAISVVATYSIFCNKLFGEKIDYVNTVYNIGFGVPIVFFNSKSINTYQKTVPVTNRIRVNVCSPFSNKIGGQVCQSGIAKGLPFCNTVRTGNGCDIIGGSYPTKGLVQPSDQDFQASMQPEWAYSGNKLIGRSPCQGLLNGGLCHLLDRYLWGLTSNRFDKFCAPETVSA